MAGEELLTFYITCETYGHWCKYHANNGSVLYGLPSIDEPGNTQSFYKCNVNASRQVQNQPTQPVNNPNVTNFGVGYLCKDSVQTFASLHSNRLLVSLVDDGASFSAIGATERFFLRSYLGLR